MARDIQLKHDKTFMANGMELEYATIGSGEPVLLIHGVFLADAMIAMFLWHPELANKYRLISYHRCGYAGSARPNRPVSMEEQAEHGKLLLDHLGIDQAHVAAHSFAGLIALQLSLSFPDRVHSLALLEPFLPRMDPVAVDYGAETVESALRLYDSGDKSGALNSFLLRMAGPDIRSAIDLTLPLNAWDLAVADVDATFQTEIPSFASWGFHPSNVEGVKRPTMPVLSVLGFSSDQQCPGFREGHEFLLSWLPQAERLGIPRATHGLQIMNPDAVLAGLLEFWANHPM